MRNKKTAFCVPPRMDDPDGGRLWAQMSFVAFSVTHCGWSKSGGARRIKKAAKRILKAIKRDRYRRGVPNEPLPARFSEEDMLALLDFTDHFANPETELWLYIPEEDEDE